MSAPSGRARGWCALALLVALAATHAAAASVATVPVFGVVAQADLAPAAATWFATNQPEVFRRLVVGAVTVDPAPATIATDAPVYHAQLVPTCERTTTGWRITGYAAQRLDRIGAQGTVVAIEWPTAAGRPSLAGSAPRLSAYVLAADGRSARIVALDDGFLFPTAGDAAGFRWRSSTPHLPATAADGWISGGGARLVAATAATTVDLTTYGGAWVQLRDRATGAYRYVREADLARSDGAPIDLVQYNGAFLLGGSFAASDATHAVGSYPRGGALVDVTFALRDALPATSIPADIPAPAGHPELAGPSSAQIAAAAASEIPTPVDPGGPAIVDTSCQRGAVPTLASDGTVVPGQDTTLYADDGQQTSGRVVDDVLAKRDLVDVAHPAADDDHPLQNPDGTTTDRLNARDTSTGASGRNVHEALADASTTDYTPHLSSGDAGMAVPDGTDDQGNARTTTVSGGDLLARHDASLDAEVQPADDGSDAQAKPIVVDAQGTVQGARVAGADADVAARIDDVNERMAPHLEGTTWTRSTRQHHGALIYPIDLVDPWMVQRWGAQTGVTTPDILGPNEPGDGDNPAIPEPNGTPDQYSAIHYAGHPFYDFDDDGDLDRWMTTDPFDTGYKKLRVRWRVEVGVKELGHFRPGPSVNVAVTGLKKPRVDDAGALVIDEDLLVHIGHQLRPFKKRKWRFGWITYYASGLITPLDPIDPRDRARYQFALRNVDASATDDAAGGDDGADPEDLIPEVETPVATITVPTTTGTEVHTVQYRIEWYARLAGQLAADDPPDPTGDWQWRWDAADAALPAGVADRATTPVIVRVTEMTAAGQIAASHVWRRPVLVDPTGEHGFDPTLVPLATAPTATATPLADAYMWDYPRERSSAEWLTIGVDPAAAPRPDVRSWRFPWNIAWNSDEHSRRRSQQAFRLNSADLSLWPDLRGKLPKITHAGLQLDRGVGDLVVQWALRETDATDPPSSDATARWRDGDPLYLATGWRSPQPWYAPGRAPFHVFGWDGRTDMYAAGRGVGGARLEAGSRLYDITGGALEFMFRGKRYLPRDLAEEYRLLTRMWNYYFTGREYPASGQTCLPSLCIPQRYDNWDLAAKPLNQAVFHDPATLANDQHADDSIGEDGRGFKLDGKLLDEMKQQQDQRERQATERRSRLMKEQIFLFSAARGREWELAMARRMPATVRLVCLEYDSKDDVQRVLGADGHEVSFPETRTYRTTDALGVTTETTVSTEIEVLRELSMRWFDVRSPQVFYANGEMSTSNQTDDQGKLPMQNISPPKFPPFGGGGSTMAKDATKDWDGFMKHLPEGLPMAYAAYAYALRGRPDVDQRQWRPDDQQVLLKDDAFEFRHPMLVLYHDIASCVYVHYGRNCDPDEVFGHWDECGPPGAIGPIASAEALRRGRFEAWQDRTKLGAIFDAAHPEGAAAERSARTDEPVEPPAAGDEPQPPTAPPWPGERPQPPIGAMIGWDGATTTTWTDRAQRPDPDAGMPMAWCPWRDDATLTALPLGDAYARWMAALTPYDDAVLGWLRVAYATADATGPAAIDVWRADAADALAPLGTAPLGRSADCFGIVVGDVVAAGAALGGSLLASDPQQQPVLQLSGPTCGAFVMPAAAYRLRLVDTADPGGAFSFATAAASTTSFASVAHPMTRAWYDALRLAPTVAQWRDLLDRRRAAAAAFDDALARWPATIAAWGDATAAYQRWLRDDATYPMRHAAWQAAVAAHAAWSTGDAAWRAANAAGAQHAGDRAAWIDLVEAVVAPAGVAWPSDPQAERDTPAALAAIDPQLPIWQAYRWFIDPANGVPEALMVEPR